MSYPSLPTRTRAEDAGLFLVVVAVPLVFAPLSSRPYVDVKLVVLLLGTILMTASAHADRLAMIASALWVGSVALASAAGLDPWWSVLGPESRGTGLVALAACAALLSIGSGLASEIRTKAAHWLFRTGVVVAAIALLSRTASLTGGSWAPHQLSSTVGDRVYVGGFIAAAVVAAIVTPKSRWRIAGLVILASGLSVTAVRSAWVGLGVGLAISAWRSRRLADVGRILALVAVVFVAWTVANAVLPRQPIEFSAAPRFAQLNEGSARERAPTTMAFFRAWRADPVLGSGPGTSWHGFLQNATDDEMRRAGRDYADAHNIVLEMGATTGTVGVLALVMVAASVLAGHKDAPRDLGWAPGAVAALGVVHLFQPLNVVLTPLLFLCAGICIRSREERRVSIPRIAMALLAIGLLIAMGRFAASSFERYGMTYASESAFETALRLEPRRLSATLELAEHRAFDFRTGERSRSDAHGLLVRAVRDHRWNPRVRLVAANIELVLDDPAAARHWVDEHRAIFPQDPEGFAAGSVLASRSGDGRQARELARRALELDPDHPTALSVLQPEGMDEASDE